jgi:hypothetical protein
VAGSVVENTFTELYPRQWETFGITYTEGTLTTGGESSVELHERDGSETAFTEPSIYSETQSPWSKFALPLTNATDPLIEEKNQPTDREEQTESGCSGLMTTCHCPSNSKTSPNRHVLGELVDKLPDAWEEIQDQLPDTYKWDIEYITTHSHSGADHGCWTCAPLEESGSVPLTIAGAPVVLPVEHQWPPVGGIQPPPDPRPSALINCSTELPMDTIRDVFLTFEGSLGFYALISGLLQIIVDEAFDTAWASSHSPHIYGGLRVCYILNTMEPTMLQSNVATASGKSAPLQTQPSRMLSTSRQA